MTSRTKSAPKEAASEAPKTGESAVTDFSKYACTEHNPIPDWRLHDLRAMADQKADGWPDRLALHKALNDALRGYELVHQTIADLTAALDTSAAMADGLADDLAERDRTIETLRRERDDYKDDYFRLHRERPLQMEYERVVKERDAALRDLADARRCIKGWEEGNIEWQKVQAERDVLKREVDQERRIRDNRANRVRQVVETFVYKWKDIAVWHRPEPALEQLLTDCNEAAQPAADEASPVGKG